jgi:hypothetical protein
LHLLSERKTVKNHFKLVQILDALLWIWRWVGRQCTDNILDMHFVAIASRFLTQSAALNEIRTP